MDSVFKVFSGSERLSAAKSGMSIRSSSPELVHQHGTWKGFLLKTLVLYL